MKQLPKKNLKDLKLSLSNSKLGKNQENLQLLRDSIKYIPDYLESFTMELCSNNL